MRLQILFVFILISGLHGQNHGPVFLLEPPAHLTFSNTTGSQVSCSAHGTPTPYVEWLLQDGMTVHAVPGLRQSLGNGTLYFPPFRAEDYRKDVHATVYRCKASNLAGTIISRDVNVRAVINRHYEIQVYHTHVSAGNTAVLGCVIPAFVKEHVTITSWSRDDSILLPGANMGGRIIVTYGTGELHIRSARAEDGLVQYSCLTLHILTQERKRSAPAMLTVTEPTRNMSPRLAPTVQTVISADYETDIHLTCSAQGQPPPVFNWFREVGGDLQPIHSSSRFEPSQDILLIRRLKLEDSGRWTCKVLNNLGEQRLDIHLTVTAHLSVHVLPQVQVVNSGENAIFNCTALGSPIGRVQWYRNGEPLTTTDGNSKIKLLNSLVIYIPSVTRHDKGMYQCVVRNERETAQGSAELQLGDTVPELQYTFIEQAMRPGPEVSFRCSATGSPPPQFRWFLDGEPLSGINTGLRHAISQFMDQSGDVVSHLNISSVRVEDGGLYSCRALNSLGSTEHSARLNIYGPPFIRSIGPVKSVAGTDIILHCPYAGYPIGSIRWERHGQELPLDLRHKIEKGGSLTILRLDSTIDSGFYTCFITSREGEEVKREIQLIINGPPILQPFTFPANLQEGGRAHLTCYVTSGDMPIHFAWYKDGKQIPASLQVEERAAEFYSMLIFKEVTSKHTGAYTCVASNSAANANYTAPLMVKVAPQWTVEPQDIAVLLGNSICIECSANGFPLPKITWLKGRGKTSVDFQPLSNLHTRAIILNNSSLYIDSVSPQDEGHYLCRATNEIGSGLTKVFYIGVNEPARFDLLAKNVSIKRGNTANLLCHVYGDLPIETFWTLNGKRLDFNNHRYEVINTNTENGVKSQVTIGQTDREDSGIYKCFAENAFGRSEYIINLAVQERPDPPSMLEVIEVSSRSVRLSWRQPFDGNSPVIGYLVQYQVLKTNHDWEQSIALNLTLPANSPTSLNNQPETAVIGGLSPATVYIMRMLAVNSIDQSQFTEALVVKTQEEEPSESPRDVKVESVSAGELFLTWSIPPRETWNGELLGYVITWNEHGISSNLSKSITVKGWATTKLQLTGLRKFTRYDISIRAYNSVSVGPASPITVGTTKEGVPEAPPQNIACSQISSQSMKLSWLAPPLDYHGGVIQGYKIYYRPIPNESDIVTRGEVKRTSSTETYLHSLYKFTNYSIRVLAYTVAGDGILSNPLYCTTEEDYPGPPANIKAAALTGESILVSWLPPNEPNGKISHFTVCGREAGRIGKHTSHIVRIENMSEQHDLIYEVRGLLEHQLYEFWVFATTSVGEGEPTAIVAQATASRAPSRIASFSQLLRKPVNSKVVLPCLAVGNPTPRSRWIYKERPITFSPFYEITSQGHLNIHSIDQSLAGNYTCSAKNLFGDDSITYSLTVLMPPSAAFLEIQFATSTSIRLHWTQPDDGGALIQGYTLFTKYGNNNWNSIELSSERTVYTLENLRCGSTYHIYLLAHNRVGSGNPSTVLTSNTKGGPPLIPKENEFITTNSTAIIMNLYNWPDGGCPILTFSIHYRVLGAQKWELISDAAPEGQISIQDLVPATWYQIRITAENNGGQVDGIFNCATTNINGDKIALPPKLFEETSFSQRFEFAEVYIITSTILVCLILFSGVIFWFIHKRQRRHEEENDPASSESIHEDKSAERDNSKNCQQAYTSSPTKTAARLPDNTAGMYEISPYATFNVAGNNSRSVTASTLDYTMQFKTFGHLEEEQHNIIYGKKHSSKHSWQNHRFYNNDVRGDSESDDTSGSPPGDCPGVSSYRVPVKSSRDLFRPDSSTESNDVSPLAERRYTPRHVGGRRQHRPVSSSSLQDDVEDASPEDMQLQPPRGFSDNRELSETECDHGMISRNQLSNDVTNFLTRYQEKKEQERKTFIIHV